MYLQYIHTNTKYHSLTKRNMYKCVDTHTKYNLQDNTHFIVDKEAYVLSFI